MQDRVSFRLNQKLILNLNDFVNNWEVWGRKRLAAEVPFGASKIQKKHIHQPDTTL